MKTNATNRIMQILSQKNMGEITKNAPEQSKRAFTQLDLISLMVETLSKPKNIKLKIRAFKEIVEKLQKIEQEKLVNMFGESEAKELFSVYFEGDEE